MTKTVMESARLWRAFLAVGPRWRYGIGQVFESVYGVIPRRKGRGRSKAAYRRFHRRLKLSQLYVLARLERDVEAARRLRKRAPKWKDAAELVTGLRGGRLPRWPQ